MPDDAEDRSAHTGRQRDHRGDAERDRVAALLTYGVLDAPAGVELEAIVRVAAAVADVPTASLNLIDSHRQCQLTSVGFVGGDSPRSESLCDVAVVEQRAQHVPDARLDTRFADNPWVRRGEVVFYASVPLRTPEGWVLGTLCVFDTVARTLTPQQMARLADCAEVVVGLMERVRMARQEQELAAEAWEQRALMELVHSELEERHELLDTVLQTVGVGIAVADAEGRLTLFNRTCREWHGVDADPALVPASWAEQYRLFHADGVTPLAAAQVPLARALQEDRVDGVEMVISRPGHPPVTVVCAARRLVAGERTIGAVVVMDDVTVRRQQEAELRSSEERFRRAFVQAPNPMALVAADAWVDVNPAFCAWLGRSHDELVGTPVADLVHPDDEADRQAAVASVTSGRVSSAQLEHRYRHHRGDHRWGRLSVSAVRGADGEQQVICQVEDVTEQRAVQQRLAHLALHDALTGLPNRALLLERLQHALAVSQRDGSVHALLFCDLDGFKAVNDGFGHSVGDEVLVEVARRLQQAVRPSDTVARLGGDEFVVLCEQVTAWSEVDGIARRLAQLVEAPVPTAAGPVEVGLSVGVSRPGPDQDAGAAISEADGRMYEVKQGRRALPTPRRRREVSVA